MSIINAIILGIVQGLTEFIPISSSGHLVIVSHFLNIGNTFTYDVMLNFGTLLALVIYYRQRLWSIIKRIVSGHDRKLLVKVVIATVPAVVIGILLSFQIEKLNGMIWVVIAALITVGVMMILFGDANKNSDDRDIELSVGWRSSIKIGLSQMFALIPGVSRSGITILTGLRSNLSAARAAEFSFLLAIPIIVGASFKVLLSGDGLQFIQINFLPVIVGNIASFVAGILAINFLIKFISKRGLKDFGWYRVILAVILAILLLTGVLT